MISGASPRYLTLVLEAHLIYILTSVKHTHCRTKDHFSNHFFRILMHLVWEMFRINDPKKSMTIERGCVQLISNKLSMTRSGVRALVAWKIGPAKSKCCITYFWTLSTYRPHSKIYFIQRCNFPGSIFQDNKVHTGAVKWEFATYLSCSCLAGRRPARLVINLS